jgi:hypothetical protein
MNCVAAQKLRTVGFSALAENFGACDPEVGKNRGAVWGYEMVVRTTTACSDEWNGNDSLAANAAAIRSIAY